MVGLSWRFLRTDLLRVSFVTVRMKRYARTMATPHSRLVDSITKRLVTEVTGIDVAL